MTFGIERPDKSLTKNIWKSQTSSETGSFAQMKWLPVAKWLKEREKHGEGLEKLMNGGIVQPLENTMKKVWYCVVYHGSGSLVLTDDVNRWVNCEEES